MSWRHWIGLIKGSKLRFDDGSKIQPQSRDCFEYSEADGRTLVVEAYVTGAGDVDRIIVSASIKQWNTPLQNDAITQIKKEEIIQKFCRYFDRIYWTYQVL